MVTVRSKCPNTDYFCILSPECIQMLYMILTINSYRMGSCNVFLWGKVKWSNYRPGVAQKVGRGIALLFHDRGTRRGWVVSSTPRPHFTPGKDPVPILQEVGWAPEPVWKGGKSRPHRDSIPDRSARTQSLYRLSYRPTFLWGRIPLLYINIYSDKIKEQTFKHKLHRSPKIVYDSLI